MATIKAIIQSLKNAIALEYDLEPEDVAVNVQADGGASVVVTIQDLEDYDYLVDDEGAERLAEDNEDGE